MIFHRAHEVPRVRTGVELMGEHGEGYCKACRFVEPLTPDGRLIPHVRPGYQITAKYGEVQNCPGSGRMPARETPYFSRKSMFRLKPAVVVCPLCEQEVPLLLDVVDLGHLAKHRTQIGQCDGSFMRQDGAFDLAEKRRREGRNPAHGHLRVPR